MEEHIESEMAQLEAERDSFEKAIQAWVTRENTSKELRGREREMLARQLHDGLSQSLSRLSLMSTIMQEKVKDSPDHLAYASRIVDIVDAAVKQARLLSRGTFLSLKPGGLRSALDNWIALFCAANDISISLTTNEEDYPLDVYVVNQLFQMVQDACRYANVIREQNAVELTLTCSNDNVNLNVQYTRTHEEAEPRNQVYLEAFQLRAALLQAPVKIGEVDTDTETISCLVTLSDVPSR